MQIRELLCIAFDNCPDVIFAVRADRKDLLDGSIGYVNPSFCTLTGFKRQEVEEQPARILLGGELPQLDWWKQSTLSDQGQAPLTVNLKRKDKSEVPAAAETWLIRDPAGESDYVAFRHYDAFMPDLALARRDQALEERNRMLEAVHALQRRTIEGGDVRLVLADCLSKLLQITNSEHGFCGEVRFERQGHPYIKADTVQTRSKDPETLRFFEPYMREGVEFRRPNSLIGFVLKNRQPVVSDAPSSDPRSGGLPAGHPQLNSFAGLPLLTSQGIAGMVGLANRPGGYSESLLLSLQPLLDCGASLIEFCRVRDKASTLAEMFQRGFDNSREALVIAKVDGEIVDWNPVAEKLFGYTRYEALGTNIGERFGDWGLSSYRHAVSAIQAKGYWEEEIAFRTHSGVETIAEMSGFAVASDGSELLMFVIRDITWRKQAEAALQEASHRFDAFAQNSKCAFWIVSADQREVLYTSPAFKTISGLDPPLDRQKWDQIIHPDDYEGFRATTAVFLKTGAPVCHKYRIILADGRIRWLQSNVFPVRDAKGEIYRYAGLLEDVTEYEDAVAKIHLALSDKEALLKEIHHRVKNNLQIISSLLRLQATSTRDPDAIAFLQESRNRVETIALLYEFLHQSENPSGINFSTYIRRLVAKLLSVSSMGEIVESALDVEDLTLDSQTTVLCGLILNEVVSNALRHAFLAGQRGKITIRVWTESRTGTINMTISDNGIGLPPGFDLEHLDTLGLRLVRRLTRQLHGTVSVTSERGVTVNIAFPPPEGELSAARGPA